MGAADIERVIANFVAGARAAFALGADAVELHAHGAYLLASFLSPRSNARADAFGGTQARRTEVLRRIVAGARAAVPPTAPLIVKINGAAGGPAGLAPAEAAEAARICRAAGADAVEVFGGMPARGRAPPRAHLAAVRAAVDAVVIASGGFVELAEMEAAVARGDCDLVALGRPLIRQPGLVRRFRDGTAAAADCIGCNGCVKWTSVRENPLKCVAKK
jgi:2,4-dienoyl-CoA reductase-like NADH-dependent reductase (Old Yellow Enzyme family)